MMEIVLSPPVKVIFLVFFGPTAVFIHFVSRPVSPVVFTMTDSVIRVHDSSTPQYKRVNEIAAKNINWCILDVGFSPNGQYFAYSTWSSSSK